MFNVCLQLDCQERNTCADGHTGSSAKDHPRPLRPWAVGPLKLLLLHIWRNEISVAPWHHDCILNKFRAVNTYSVFNQFMWYYRLIMFWLNCLFNVFNKFAQAPTNVRNWSENNSMASYHPLKGTYTINQDIIDCKAFADSRLEILTFHRYQQSLLCFMTSLSVTCKWSFKVQNFCKIYFLLLTKVQGVSFLLSILWLIESFGENHMIFFGVMKIMWFD